jgi:FK506-binding protein 15
MFDNEEEKCAFSKLLLVCKYNVSEKSGNDSSILVQDLMLGNENSQIVAEDNDTIEVKYNGWLFDDKNSVGKLFVNHESMTKKPFRIKLESEWTQVFRGLKTDGKRYVIIPFKMREKFSEILENAPIEQVLRYGFEFQLIKIRPRKVSQSEKQIDENEQTISDSNETDKQQISDTTTRLRTLSASVKDESQPNKSKSDILSRVARMGGLPILPIKIESNTKSESINATDAHNNEEEIIQMKPLPKPRNNSIQSVNNLQIDTSVTDSNDKIPDSKTNSNQIPTNVPQIPVTNSYQIPSYFMTQNTSIDSNLSLLTNETRINNSEVRMTLTKIIDKIDLVSEKISDIKNNANSSIPSIPVSSIGFMDSTILLSSIQKIVNDNNNLKKELEDKTVRLQTLNEKICDLLQQQSINTKSYNPSEEIERLLTNESRLKRELNVLREDCERYKANNQDLNLENAQLKNKIHELKSQIQTNSVNRVDEELNITQTKEFTSQVKKIMNDVFRKFMSQIDENKTYPTEEIVQIVTNSIRSVTFALIESRSNSERNSPSHQSFDEIDVNKINYEKSKNVFNTNVLESNFKKELKKPPIPERKIIETQQKTNEDNDSDQFKDDSIKDSDLDNYVVKNFKLQ